MAYTFQDHDIAGYQGKNFELWVKRSNVVTGPNEAAQTAYQIRGAQNFNPSEEVAESRVSELGYAATKTIYGTASYSVSITMLLRDLVQVGRLAGKAVDSGRIVVTEFNPINCLVWVKNPDDDTDIFQTVYVGALKGRTASKSIAVEANATVTLDGSADMVALVDGKANMREHEGDGSCTMFEIESGVGAGDIYLVENPSGEVLARWDGYTFVASGIGGNPSVEFTTAPMDDTKVKVVYKYQ